MDWSKKIGVSILIVLFLASCSNRRNYGSVYFSGGDAMNNESLKKELSVEDYMNSSDSADYFVESVDRYAKEETDTIITDSVETMDTLEAKINTDFPKSNLDTLYLIERISADTTVTHKLVMSKIDTIKDIAAFNARKIDTVRILSQEQQIKMLNERNDSINRLNIEEIDSVQNNDSIPEPTSVISKKVDSTRVLTQKDQILQLRNQNDSLNRSKLKEVDSAQNEMKAIVPVILNKNDSIADSDSLKTEMSDSNQESSQEEQIRKLEEENDSLSKLKARKIDSIKSNSSSVVPVIITTSDSIQDPGSFNENNIDTTEVILNDDPQVGVALSDSLEKISDSIARQDEGIKNDAQSDTLDEVNDSSSANIKENDTLFYSVSFDSTNVVLNNSNKETLDALVKEASERNFVLELSGQVDKSDTLGSQKQLINNRLDAVKSYLVSKGLNKDKISTLSINQNISKNGRNLNEGTIYCKLIIRD